MNRSVQDVGGGLLVVSQFTLLANYRHGNRPDFLGAAAPAEAERLYRLFLERAAETVPVQHGQFGADMQVSLCNDGPVTIVMDSGGAEARRGHIKIIVREIGFRYETLH